MKLAFLLGQWSTGLHGRLAAQDLYVRRALTGSESSFFNAARALSSFGHKVDIYCDTPDETPGFAGLDGASVLSLGREIPDDYAAYISLNEPGLLKNVGAGLKVCWQQLGDFPGFVKADCDDSVDRYVALSPGHMEHIQRSSSAITRMHKWSWIPNSINMEFFQDAGPRIKGKMIWCSSPDRGLHNLIEIFPAIKARVPEATLDIYYRFAPWYETVKGQAGPIGDRARYIEECLQRTGRNGENGIRVMEARPNVEMAKALVRCSLVPYTCDVLQFTESFSVSVMDACASGAQVIISNADALPSIYGNVVRMISGNPRLSKDLWTISIVEALENADGRSSQTARDFASKFDRNRVGRLWEKFLHCSHAGLKSVMPETIPEFLDLPLDETLPVTVAKINEQKTNNDDVFVKFQDELVKKTWPKPSGRRKLRIAVIMGKLGSPVHGRLDVAGLWDDEQSFITGTVSGFFNIVWGLAEKGHSVDAFCDCLKTEVNAGHLGGANVYKLDDVVIDYTYDAYISINEPDMLRGRPLDKLRVCAMWLNDFSFCRPGHHEFVSQYVSPSQSHLQYLLANTDLDRDVASVIPLSVNPEFHSPGVRRPGSVAYASSPDRGLHHLLDIWPDIRALVPDATLRIYYRLKPWYDGIVAENTPSLMRSRADHVWKRLDELGRAGENGVTVVGPVTPKKMARELSTTKVLAYPCDPVRYTEGFSATVLDACAAGCVPVIAGVDALPEVYWNAAHMIFGNPAEKRAEWISAICSGLTDEGFASEIRVSAKLHSRNLTRAKVATMWEEFLWKHLEGPL